ncbi:sulfotransferase family protein [Teredinibacter waterburyi]|jgi:Sulfotransferase domain.|uniref:sulfotransferase family protein n=1 Tax=Teredinibacter waterburyi TaxID=1500538 RepID=UPI00165F0105|nr:sulfotransferase [Teredinibacter waterburyi]
MTIADTEVTDSPVFVVGPLRSGTTLLRLILDHHPDINAFGEFEAAVSEAVGNTWPELSSFHEFLATDRQAGSYNFTVDKSLSYEQLVHSFVAQLHQRNPKSIIAASVHSRQDLLPKLWPNARFIHLLRDPRDVARSCIGMGWVGNVFEGAKYWLEPEQHWDLLKQQVKPEQIFEIRYEEMVKNPEQELTKLCEFLGLTYTDEMLQLEARTSYTRPDAKFAEQWKRKMSVAEISWVEHHCKEMMQQRGYALAAPDAPSISPLTRLRLKAHSHLYRINLNIKRWGFFTWLAFVVSKRLGLKGLKAKMQQRINIRSLNYLK